MIFDILSYKCHFKYLISENNGKLNIKSVNRDCPAVSSPVLVPDTQTASVSVSHNGPVRPANVQTPCTNTARSHETPKRCKRKFPGPAGLLPKLVIMNNVSCVSEIKSLDVLQFICSKTIALVRLFKIPC